MKTKNLFDKIIQLSQAELESMSFTRQATIRVNVSKECKLPELEVKGADVTIGDGKVVVTKKRTPQPYAGNVSKVVYRLQSSYGKSYMRVTKDGGVHLHLTGTVQSMKDKHDIISALVVIMDSLAEDGNEMNTSEMSDNMLQQWTKAQKAHDAQEKREQRAWETREKNDLRIIEQ
jgi:hypothetical protein